MRITPIDIETRRFPMKFRGFHPEEVSSFLEQIREELEDLLRENAALKERIHKADEEIQRFWDMQDLLSRTVQDAHQGRSGRWRPDTVGQFVQRSGWSAQDPGYASPQEEHTMISGKTSIFGIFGHPVEHSFSPGMHNAALAAIGLDGCYVPFAVHPDDLGNAVKAIAPLGLCGLNITVPHKEKVILFLDDLTDDARLIGGVNTIELRDKKLIGHNTDGKGFLRSLREETGFRPKGKTFLMVGSGGAARAVCFELALVGARDILLHDIDRDKAEKLGHDIRFATATR